MEIDYEFLVSSQSRYFENLKGGRLDPNRDFYKETYSFKHGLDYIGRLNEYLINGNNTFDMQVSDIDRIIMEMKLYNISIKEASIIMLYAGSHSEYINIEYHHDKLSERSNDKIFFENCLSYVLSKLPSYSGIVYRRDTSPDFVYTKNLEKLKRNIGNCFKVPFFLSTFGDKREFDEYSFKIQTLSENSKAKNIMYLSDKPNEKEVLFSKDSYFKIISIDENNKIIDVKEVVEPNKICFTMQGKDWLDN